MTLPSDNFALAQYYVHALTGSPDTVMEWRCIHDQDKSAVPHLYKGSLADVWDKLLADNQAGYGVFTNINVLDGLGREMSNVAHIRSHVVDLDDISHSQQSYERAVASEVRPTFVVQTSAHKYHLYWVVEPYVGNDFYTIHQRKLRQLFQGDPRIVDPTRVLRVPGFMHCKGTPQLVTVHSVSNERTTADTLRSWLEPVEVFETIGERKALGDPSLAAPSLEYLVWALNHIDPNDLDYGEWVSCSAAFKQAGWTLATEDELRGIWEEWCNQYNVGQGNNTVENRRTWNSFREVQLGWRSFERRTPVKMHMARAAQGELNVPNVPTTQTQQAPVTTTETDKPERFGDLLDGYDCERYFRGCYFIVSQERILTPNGRMLKQAGFNGLYGGKKFFIDVETGRGSCVTDEAWKAATRSVLYTIPKIDHTVFRPDLPPFTILENPLGQAGINTYVPIKYRMVQGDVTFWLDWLDKILPDKNDQRILIEYMAHCVQYPGVKIHWAPFIQSAQGIGKTIFQRIFEYALGEMYVHMPNAEELTSSGNKFNAWMSDKLMILVDEVKDGRQDLVEILKPIISGGRIEIQGKGADQVMGSNLSNWMFFSNLKDGIPTGKERRFAAFYSALQTEEDVFDAGMDAAYFRKFWEWADQGGMAHVAYYLANYPVERGSLDNRAPRTSSYEESLIVSRTPMESAIFDAVEDEMKGFRGGYVGSTMVARLMRESGVMRNTPTEQMIKRCLEGMGYIRLGRAKTFYPLESNSGVRPTIYANRSSLTLEGYGAAQGYEVGYVGT